MLAFLNAKRKVEEENREEFRETPEINMAMGQRNMHRRIYFLSSFRETFCVSPTLFSRSHTYTRAQPLSLCLALSPFSILFFRLYFHSSHYFSFLLSLVFSLSDSQWKYISPPNIRFLEEFRGRRKEESAPLPPFVPSHVPLFSSRLRRLSFPSTLFKFHPLNLRGGGKKKKTREKVAVNEAERRTNTNFLWCSNTV